ncbi:glycosyltransferase family 2 protein [Luteimonas soli]|uniref:Glycosyltransferase family 2 protein n=2 Tax=Luteimonas soli TaxID=1648966 RepID=A0ABV7XF36_9GAMM
MESLQATNDTDNCWVDVMRPEGTGPLAGWYQLQSITNVGGGEWVADRIRSADGKVQPVRLSSLASRSRSIVLFTHEAAWVQLRVVSGEGVAARSGLKFRRIGRVRAFAVMLEMIGVHAAGGVRAALGAAGDFIRTAIVYGVSAGAEGLHACYRMVIGEGAPVELHPAQVWRLRRRAWWPRSDRLLLTPIAQLVAKASPLGGVTWEATTGKPRFGITRMDGSAPILKAGWYRLTGRLTASTGRIVAPCFYLNYATGKAQPLPVQIRVHEPGVDGRVDMSIRFTHDVSALRFDPSTGPARFTIGGFQLRRMGRPEWMSRLLAGLCDEDGRRDWPAIVASATDMSRLAAQGRLRSAGELLAERYIETSQRHAGSYAAWVRKYDTLSVADREAMTSRGQALAVDGPKISLLVPVYQTPERWLRSCLDSVLAQAYPNWELCIADDASPSPHVREVLEEYQRRDARIRVRLRKDNGHISEASNTALDMACGDYVGLLDHDDELRPHALLEVVEAIVARPGLELIYSDEDKIDEAGRRFQPYFKPEWNPDLLLSQNYVCHFTVIRTLLARNVGGFRKGFEGSQDHDLILRCSREIQPWQIHHVPRVLYHWRAIAGSTALERKSKDYASSAGVCAVREYVRGIAPHASVDELPHGHYRVRWPVPQPAPKVSLIIPTRDRVGLLRTCVESLLAKTGYPNFELVVVDNQSYELDALAYLDELRSRERVKVLKYDAPFNYSAINNWAAAHCDGELLCMLNNDIEAINGDWLDEMAGFACRPDIGAVGAMLYYPDDSIQHAGVILGLGGVANHAYCHQPADFPGHGARALVAQNLSAVTGACLLVRREVFEQVGGLDERLRITFNDIDFCLRVREAGYRNAWTPFATLYHHESASRGADDTLEKVARFRREVALMRERWSTILDNDPAYNPNLSIDIADTASQLAFPPRQSRWVGG